MTKDTQIWLAQGVEKPWRVCSNLRTYGEYSSRQVAEQLRELLVAGGKFTTTDSPTSPLTLVKP